MNIAIVDDELADSVRLNSFLRDWLCTSNYEAGRIYCYSSGEDILKNFVPGVLQVIFMDILIGSSNGIDIAKQISYMDSEVLIIFLTTSKEFVFDAFPIHAFDYSIKPCTKKNVNNVLKFLTEELPMLLQEEYINRIWDFLFLVPLGATPLISWLTPQYPKFLLIGRLRIGMLVVLPLIPLVMLLIYYLVWWIAAKFSESARLHQESMLLMVETKRY